MCVCNFFFTNEEEFLYIFSCLAFLPNTCKTKYLLFASFFLGLSSAQNDDDDDDDDDDVLCIFLSTL